jgi:hypothetical protein
MALVSANIMVFAHSAQRIHLQHLERNITKKAYWSKRPEAKEVYEGKTPAGVTVYEIDQDYLARFADGENNGLDKNYIIFPKGQRVYKKGNTVYAAICGNKLEYFKPLDILKKTYELLGFEDKESMPALEKFYSFVKDLPENEFSDLLLRLWSLANSAIL